LAGVEHIDLVDDLFKIDLGVAYKLLQARDDSAKYGHIFAMALSSKANLGAVNSEGFCERVLSCANFVLNDHRTLLSDEELEMVVCLRVNKKFMEYGRHKFPAVLSEKFGFCVAPM
jgi:hypothetical protein